MDEHEARENVRPLGNVYRMRDDEQIPWDEANDANRRVLARTEPLEPEEKPYPQDALASRAAPPVEPPVELKFRARVRVMARIANLRTEADELEAALERGEW